MVVFAMHRLQPSVEERERDTRKNRARKNPKKTREPLENNLRGLTAKEITKYLKNCSSFLGCFTLRQFKDLLIKLKTFSVVINCDAHWFCIFSTENTLEIFDPLGFLQKKKCFKKSFINFLKIHLSGKVLYSNPKLQSEDSFACGFYVIFYIRMREMGHTFLEIYHKFGKRFRKNDRLVTEFVQRL